MIRSFADAATDDIFAGRNTKHARRAVPRELWSNARRKLAVLDAAHSLAILAVTPGYRLEVVPMGHSIRISLQYRITFRFVAPDAYDVRAWDYHDVL